MPSELIYLASPYSYTDPKIRLKRFQLACEYAAKLMAKGHLIFSPIAHTHPILIHSNDLSFGWDHWKKYDEVFLVRCDKFVILPLDGWLESKGIRGEVDIWQDSGRPIEMVDLETLEIKEVTTFDLLKLSKA